ncbi:MAG: hypothetical protein H7A01_12570 [Hahellaceae bacterium]|jgi:hypothetical protein|nr:hypothetical protein [Hahellaceae bacterium]MCP5209848.1 hypothetical protein [Hahellaceae bacterium]
MNRGNQWGGIAAALALNIFSTQAQATTIDFEEFGLQPYLFADAPALNIQYLYTHDVRFSRHQSPGKLHNFWEILNEDGNFGIDARSGEHFLAFSKSIGTQAIDIVFTNVTDQFSAFVGAGSNASWTFEAYFNSGLVHSEVVTSAGGTYSELSLSGLLFDKVSVISSAASGVMDDLFFKTAASSVPVSSTLLLMLAGLLYPIGKSRTVAAKSVI